MARQFYVFLISVSVIPAGDTKVYERVLDYNKIVEALALPKGLPDTNPYRSTPCKFPRLKDVKNLNNYDGGVSETCYILAMR